MSKKQFDKFKDIPLRNVAPVSMEEPNEPIEIYTGDFAIKDQTTEYQINGSIIFKWFPAMKVKFTGKFLDDKQPKFGHVDFYELLIEGHAVGKIAVTNIEYGKNGIVAGESGRFIYGENTIPVNEVNFLIPNMREYFGDPVKQISDDSQNMQKARLILDDKPYKIILDKYANFNERQKKLDDKGGYLATYAGKIIKKGGSISLSDLHKWHDRFHHFLYFLNGRRVAPMFYTGSFEDQNIWTDYSAYTVDSYKYVWAWSDIMLLHDLPQLWKSYNKLWRNENDQDFLITAIHWYVEANSNAGMVEGSIILIQTALELIYNWLIIEHQKIIVGTDADGLTAANKIRMLIYQIKIDSAIPTAFTELAAIKSYQDGPDAFTKIRNALVHGQEAKRTELRKVSDKAKSQALHLGIWYVELSLLYILGYKGNYRNRTDGNRWRNTGVPVPWVNDKSFKIGKPSEFTDDEIHSFVELLEKQNKVQNQSETKVKRCKLLGIGFSWGQPVAIGAIKQKTVSDFEPNKANLPELAKDYSWEIGYFFTEPEYQGKGFSSAIIDKLLRQYGKEKLMATTEIREGNSMISILERRAFKQFGNSWSSAISEHNLRLFLKD